MQELLGRIRNAFTIRGEQFFAEHGPPHQVDVRAHQRLVLVRADFGRARHTAVVKCLDPDATVRCPRQLVDVHDRIRALSVPFARSSPRLLGYDGSEGWVVMNHLPGLPLLTLLRRSIWMAGWGQRRCRQALEQTAHLLATLHRLTGEEVGLQRPTRTTASFLPALQDSWSDPLIRPHLPAECRSADCLSQWLSDACLGREGRSLLLVDSQPKNVLVSAGDVYLIDLDYSVSRPALGVGHFLASLDRFGLRHPMAVLTAQVARWKKIFAAAYLARASAATAEDLAVYYPWALLHSFQQQRRRWPRLARYLGWYYGRLLGQFLNQLRQLPAKDGPARFVNLFQSAPASA